MGEKTKTGAELQRQNGFNFAFDASACQECGGKCCTGESGFVFVSAREIAAAAAFLGLSIDEFGRRFLRKVGYKYSFVEKDGGALGAACVFFDLDTKKCAIYDARPIQCRSFPFWPVFLAEKPAGDSKAESVVDSNAESVVDSNAESVADSNMESAVDSQTDSKSKPATTSATAELLTTDLAICQGVVWDD